MEIGNNVGIANFILGKLLICTGPVHGTFRALHALIGGGNWNNGGADSGRQLAQWGELRRSCRELQQLPVEREHEHWCAVRV